MSYAIRHFFSEDARRAAAEKKYSATSRLDENGCCPIGVMLRHDSVPSVNHLPWGSPPSHWVDSAIPGSLYAAYEFIADWDGDTILDLYEALGVPH